MANGSIIPPDVKEQMRARDRQPTPGLGGVGVAAAENVATARQREFALNPDAAVEELAREEPAPTKEPAVKLQCANTACNLLLKEEWRFCPKCGRATTTDPAKKLKISFTEEDIESYLFKGFVLRDVALVGKHTVTLKSSEPQDMDQIDDYMMNGDWAKNEDGSERKISSFFLQQMNSICIIAASVQKMDGTSIGNTLKERIDWVYGRGAALVDMLSQKVMLFNQAFTEYLNNENAILGS